MEHRERERAQWVREVQHEMAQKLTGLRCHLAAIERTSDGAVADRAGQAGQLVDALARWVRDLAIRVRPPMLDDLGLGPTLTWYVGQVEQQTGRRADLTLQGLETRLPYLVETAGFRVASTILPEVLAAEGVEAVQLHVVWQQDVLWLFANWSGGGPETGATAAKTISEWVVWLEGTVRLDRIPGAVNLSVMLPALAPTGG
jgi:signal transduction histidine kinase